MNLPIFFMRWLLLGCLMMLSALVSADDTEIYTLQSTSQTLGGQGVHVILLIDNSGSFAWCIDQNNFAPQTIPGTNTSPDPNCKDATSSRSFQMRKVVTWLLNQLDPNTSVGLFTYGKDANFNAAGGSMLAPLRPLNSAMASPATSLNALLATNQTTYGSTWKDYLLNWVQAPQQGSDISSPYYFNNMPTNWLYEGVASDGSISNLAPEGGTPLLAAYGEILSYLKGANVSNNLSGGDNSFDQTILASTGYLSDSVQPQMNCYGYSCYVQLFNSGVNDQIFPTPVGWNSSALSSSSFMNNDGAYYPPADYASLGESCVAPSWHIIIITDGGANIPTGMSQVLPIIGSSTIGKNNLCNANNPWDSAGNFMIGYHGPDGGYQIDYSCAVAESYYLNNATETIPVPNGVTTDASLTAPTCSGTTSTQQCICKSNGATKTPTCKNYSVTPEVIPYNNGLGVNVHTHVVFIGPESAAGSVGDTNGYNDAYDAYYMSQIASAGGGQFFSVTNYQQLATALASITRQVVYQSSTIVAPGVAVNQMNRFNFLDQLYYSEFQPQATSVWQGNLKRYWLHSSDGSNSPSSLIVADATGAEALDPMTQFFYNTSKSCWGASGATATTCLHDTEDGSTVQLGGELQVINPGPGSASSIGRPVYISRDNYTGTDTGHVVPVESFRQAVVAGTVTASTAQGLFNLPATATTSAMSNLMYWMEGVDLTKSDFSTTPATYVSNNWMGDPLHSQAVLVNYGYSGWGGATATTTNQTAEAAAAENASLQYNYVFVSTNGGDLHAVNVYDGKEAMIWVPQEELPMQNVSYGSQMGTSSPSTTSSRSFGLDLTWTSWRHDGNGDGYIDPNNFPSTPSTAAASNDWVYLYGGMRMGGSTLYALNVSNLDNFYRHPPSGWNTLPAQPSPPLGVMWTIQGPLAGGYTSTTDSTDSNNTIDIPNKVVQNAPASTSPYAYMGQTWSKPVLTTIAWGTTTQITKYANGTTSSKTVDNPRQVLIFGGGYDPKDETEPYGSPLVIPKKTFGQNTYGHQIYIVDAETGNLLFWASGGNPSGVSSEAAASLYVPGMNYSITGSVQVMDRDNDGFTDAIYYTDLGGQLWRLDLSNSGTNGGAFNSCSGYSLCPSLALGAVKLMDDGEALLGATPSASLSSLSEQRRFYSGVTAALMQQPATTLYNANPVYVGVAFGSGNDSHPRLIGTQDRLYMFEDYTLFGVGSLNRSAYVVPTVLNVGSSSASNIVNVTNYSYSSTGFNSLFSGSPKTAVFYMNLNEAAGEKSLSMPTIFNGVINATTYVPNNSTVVTQNACVPQIGTSNFWGFSAFDGRGELTIPGSTSMVRSLTDVGLGITNMSLVLTNGTAVYVGGKQTTGTGTGTGGDVVVGSTLPNNGIMIRRWYQKR